VPHEVSAQHDAAPVRAPPPAVARTVGDGDVKTDDLVSLLATGAEAVDARAPARRAALALAAGLLPALAFTVGVLGLEPELLRETRIPMFWVREAFCAGLGMAGMVAVARLARPGRRLGAAPVGIAVPLLLMGALALLTLALAAPGLRLALVLGQTAAVCPFLIALVSLPLFAAFLAILRGLAPTRLRWAGAAAGAAAGAIGALVYTLHCPELAAPFLATWYVLGMAIPTCAGALLGPRLLRW
jgi:hypothetical protein